MRTYSPKPGDITREWHVIDAEDIVLGRLAVQAANLLRGKHKPTFAPHMDMGDFVIVVNAEKVALTGDKKTTKLAYRHSGYPGGLTATPIGDQLEKDARKVIEKAVWGMLPKNKLGRQIIKKLKVYAGPDAPAPGPEGRPVRDHPDLPVVVDHRASRGHTHVTSESTEATEHRGRRDRGRGDLHRRREGVAYSSESEPTAEAVAARPATIAPAAATGRRKEAVARVRIVPGTGVWTVNGRALDSYFPNKLHQQVVNEPFAACQVEGRFDVIARIHGGGITGQAGALRLGVARCLNEIDVEANRPALKSAGLLTRDARVIERKKAGLKKARKAPQFSKR